MDPHHSFLPQTIPSAAKKIKVEIIIFLCYNAPAMEEEQQQETGQINLLEPRTPSQSQTTRTQTNKKVIFLIITVVVLALATIFVIRAANSSKWPANAAAYDPISLQPKKTGFFQTIKNFIFHSDNIITGQQEDRINILILGIGGPGHDGPYLSDTNIVISLKPSTKEAALISIPRDLAVKIDGHGLRKINNADAFGEAEKANNGGEYARQIFAETFNLDIPYYIRLDFTAFTDIINAVGGIDINVPRSFTDYQYPGAHYSFVTTSFKAGPEHMDGARALVFARSRHGNNGEGSDFARAKRQQLVLSALKAKILSANTLLNPVTIQKIWDSLSQHVVTNLDFAQMMYIANLGKDVDGNIRHLVIDDSVSGYLKPVMSSDGAYLLVPKTGDFTDINNAVQNVFESTSTNITEEIVSPQTNSATSSVKVEIQNGTWRAGLAAKIKSRLEENGFAIPYVSNSIKRPIAVTTLYIVNKNSPSEVVKSLTATLRAQASNTLPDWLQENYDDPGTAASEAGLKYKPDADILVILGDDASKL